MKFREKLVIPIVILLFLSTSILGSIIYFNVALDLESQIIERSTNELNTVKATMDSQNRISEEIKSELGKAYTSAASSVAKFISDDPSLLTTENMNKLAKELDLDEIHVIDGNGVLVYGNVSEFHGFNFNDSEQTRPFLDIITGKTDYLVQDPEPRGSNGLLYQYVGVKRVDAPGLIQVGLNPDTVQSIHNNLDIRNYIYNIQKGEDDYVYVIDNSGNIVIHPNIEGSNLSDEPFIQEMISNKNGNTKYTFKGVEKIATYQSVDDYIIVSTESMSTLNNLKDSIFRNILIIVILCIAIGIGVIYVIVNKLALNPINKVVAAIHKVESGNLDIEIVHDTKDEFGILAKSFNVMVSNVRNLVSQINNLSENLKSSLDSMTDNAKGVGYSSEEVARTIQEIAIGATSQAQDSRDALNLTNILSDKVKVITSDLNVVMESTNNMNEKNNIGRESLRELKSKLSENENSTIIVSESVKDLSEKSNLIGSILEAIEGISQQINLLSLNAAIEAARAGEHGHGFAVVAGEIRNLAEESNSSTNQIRSIIGEIQGVIKDTTANMNITKDSVNNANIALEKTSEVFDNLRDSVSESIKQIETLGNEIIEVDATKENVLTSIESISSLTEQSAASTEEISASTQEQTASIQQVVASISQLGDMANELTNLVQMFKL